MKNFNYRIFSLFLFIVISWGLAWPVNKMGLQYMSPIWYTAARLLIGAGVMLCFVFATKKLSLPRRQDLPLILIIGLVEISGYIILANIGLVYMPAGRSSLLAYTTPLWVMPIAVFFLNEKPSRLKWSGFFFGITGLVILLSPWEMDWTDTHILVGTSALLLASFCWAISMLCARHMQWTKSPLELIPWQLLIAAIPILIFAWIKEPLVTVVWNNQLILSLLYTGVLVTGLSYWCGNIITRELPTIVVSIGFLIVPVFSLLISSYFLHEAITLPMSIAMSFILLGLICIVV